MYELPEKLRKYVPETISPLGIPLMIARMRKLNKDVERLKETYSNVNKAWKDYSRSVLRTRSNNWLKLHGYPMRRGNENRDLGN